MRVLVHIHAFNDGAVIDNLLDALRRQTRPADAFVVIDNASTDDTLDREFPEKAVVIRNATNTGSCGAVHIGLAHALKGGFDWTWVFDADSVPEADALANLLAFYDELTPEEQERVYMLASNMVSAPGAPQDRPMIFTNSGVEFVSVDPAERAMRIDFYKWSGALFRMEAMAKIGLPSPDYFIDFGELEFGYRASRLGLRGYLVVDSVVRQDVGRPAGVVDNIARLGPFKFRQYNLSPLRCYYRVRNLIYFWVYERRPRQRRWVFRSIRSGLFFPRNFLLRPVSHRRHLVACARGFWDGMTMQMGRRY